MASRDQRGYLNKGGIAMMDPRIEDRRSKIRDQRSKIEDQGSKIENHGSGIDAILDPRSAILDPRVAATSLPAPTYTGEPVSQALDRVTKEMQWSEGERGPFGRVIPRGARVLVKPNLVLHENQGAWGIDPLVTHLTLIQAVVEGALRAEPSEVIVGDAPVQGCDFDTLLNVTGLSRWAEGLMKLKPTFKGILDFRRTSCIFENGVRLADENRLSEERFVLFDLGCDSLLEPVTDG